MGRGINYQAMQLVLAQRSTGAGNSASVAQGTVATLNLLATHLTPLIGARGFDVLLVRALHVTSGEFAWLGDDWSAEAVASRFAMLTAVEMRLAGGQVSAATHASCAMLMNFSVILAGLIGESLAERLLTPIWAPAALASEKEASP
jgi:hypothetical protein